jgi:hypothetical protein
MLSTRFLEFLLFFLQFSLYGASLVLPDEEQAGFIPSTEGLQHVNTQQLMGATFASFLGDSNTDYHGGSLDEAFLGCVDNQNVTMHVGDRSVVFSQGKVKALPDVEPTVWAIRPYPSNSRAFHIYHLSPFGAQISWYSSTYEGSQVEASRNYKSEMQIKYASGTVASPRVLIAREGNCIRFNEQGNAEVHTGSPCKPLSMRIAKPVEWRDAADKNECPSTVLHKALKKAEDDMKDEGNVHTTNWKDTAW